MNGGDEVFKPWTASSILQALEFASNRSSMTTLDPVIDSLWQRKVENLLFWANHRPDVAARMLESVLFVDRPFTAGKERQAVLERLRDMCHHAMAVHRKQQEEAAKSAGAEDRAIAETGEVAQEEVTFAATFMERLLNGAMPDVFGALESVIVPSALKSGTHSELSSAAAVDDLIDSPLQSTCSVHCKRIAAIHTEQQRFIKKCEEEEEAEKKMKKELQATSTVSLPTKLRLRAPPKNPPPPPDTVLPIASCVPLVQGFSESLRKCDKGLVASASAWHIPVLYAQLQDSPVPLKARSREEMRREMAAKESKMLNTTLVRADGTIAEPEWAAGKEKEEEQEEEEMMARDDTVVQSSSVKFEDPQRRTKRSEGTEAELIEGAVKEGDEETAKDGVTNAGTVTWVKDDGELVMVAGRFVVRPKEKKRTVEDAPAVKGKRAPEPAKPLTASTPEVETLAPNAASVANTTGTSSGDTAPTEVGVKRKCGATAASSTSQKRKRKKTAADDGEGDEGTVSAVSLEGVSLKTREELIEQVEHWDIPQVLKEAFLIGLEPEACSPVRQKLQLHLNFSPSASRPAGNGESSA